MSLKSARLRQNLSGKLELMERIEAQKPECEKEASDAARETCEAETAKHDAEELLKRDELEIMERIELEKHDIEREKIEAAEAQYKEDHEAAEAQRKEDREVVESHDQLLCVMEKAKLALEQERINLQQFQQQRNYEF